MKRVEAIGEVVNTASDMFDALYDIGERILPYRTCLVIVRLMKTLRMKLGLAMYSLTPREDVSGSFYGRQGMLPQALIVLKASHQILSCQPYSGSILLSIRRLLDSFASDTGYTLLQGGPKTFRSILIINTGHSTISQCLDARINQGHWVCFF